MKDLDQFKFYLASNFYQDNIGVIELVDKDGEIIKYSFPHPTCV